MRTIHWLLAIVIGIAIAALFYVFVSILYSIVSFVVLVGLVYLVIRLYVTRKDE